MTPVLNDLLNDDRLARLFSKDSRHCALQLWILQIKSAQVIENRIVYSRLLPYSYSCNCWSSTEDDNFQPIGQVKAQVIRLNLYIKSGDCADLLRQLSAARSVSEISKELSLDLSPDLNARFGATTLAANLVYRPVAYLLNRDAYDRRSLPSPHGGAGAFSASITQIDKRTLFLLGQDYDVALTALVVNHLNADTGLDFGGVDSSRLGDIELLVFPALDDFDRAMLNVNWVDNPWSLIVKFNPVQVPNFSGFLFHLNITNDNEVIYSSVSKAERNAEHVFECKFELSDQLRTLTDSTELEIFGFHGDNSCGGTLCCRWRGWYIREVNLQGHMVGGGTSPVKFDWLERTTKPPLLARMKAALTINRGNSGFINRIGARDADPWVPINRDLRSLFARLHPPKSDGQFFLRWGHEDSAARVKFFEWFKALLAKYPQNQVAIFDPYFDAVGLNMVLICAANMADYIVFRSLPKPKKQDIPQCRKSDKTTSDGLDNLLANCEQNSRLLEHIKLRIYGLKEGQLHDRYILIMGLDGLPVAGFNLSNSLQSATENHPLLITPIPTDVLLEVEQYKFGLVQAAKLDGETENPSVRLLFDSTTSPASPTVSRRNEPLCFLEKAKAGDVLSVWTGEPSLKGLSGDSLNEQMAALDLLKDGSLTLPQTTAGLRNFLDQQAGDFTATWEVIGEVLAHSRTEAIRFLELESQPAFLEFLAQFLEESFKRTHDVADKELTVVDAKLFRKPVEALLHSSFYPHLLFHPTKYAALTWSEYYAIKFLWWHAPDALLEITEGQVAGLPEEPQGPDVMRLSLLSQIISEISLSVQFDISDAQRDRLVCSDNGLMQWMGLNAIERLLEKPGGLAAVLQLVCAFPYQDCMRALGWMIQHAASIPEKVEIYKGLIAALHKALPPTISVDELRCLVDSMRGHMQQLAWAEPWLFRDVVLPLLQNSRANTDDACLIWIQELAGMLEQKLNGQSRLFDLAREGQTTNITAFLFSDSSHEQQQASLKLMKAILNRNRRIVRQPLASTSDWTRWNDALVISMWILTFIRWGQYYLRERGMTNGELDDLSQDARELAMIRPMVEWRSEVAGKPGQLAAFLDQVDALLSPRDESKSKL